MSARTWRLLIGIAVLVGLAIRLAEVLGHPNRVAAGDPLEYLGQANLLAQGKGWIEPLRYAANDTHAQTAKLPPLYTMLLALCSLVGLKSFFADRIWSGIIGTTAIGLAAVVGRDLAGRRVGVIAALLVALYPNIWMSDALGMSETITPIVVLLVLWAAYRAYRDPRPGRIAVLGLCVGIAALARDELTLLVPFVMLPLVIGPRARAWRERGRLAAAGLAAAVLVVGPWVGYNLSRFSHPVFITDRFGLALATANCDSVWHGPGAGYWSMQCAEQAIANVTGDESAADPVALRHSLDYIGKHLAGLPVVEFERLGRTFGFYRPIQQIGLDSSFEGRPRLWAFVGLGLFYVFSLAAIPGARALRRKGLPLFPMIGIAAAVVVSVLATYGQTRFRAPLEPVIVLLAAVVADGAFTRWRDRAGTRTPALAESAVQRGPMSDSGSVPVHRAASGA